MSAQEHKQALPAGFRLGSYRVVRVLGVGGFGITYLCEHAGLGVQVAVKEYLPNEIAVRDSAAVHPKSAGDREGFEWGLSRFLDEAKTLARFEHPNVVRVRDCFEANSTAYIVMDYEDGESLDRLLRRLGTLTEAQLKRVVLPVAEGLREVHAAGFLHRDVKPSNIFVRRSDESPVLLDFGSARQALGRKSRSMTAIASAGYSPPEQYESQGSQGAWTDIYALSALCYRAITGETPAEAPWRTGEVARSREDPQQQLAAAGVAGYSSDFLGAVDLGLRLAETERPRSLEEWLARVDGGRLGAAEKDNRSTRSPLQRTPRQADTPETPEAFVRSSRRSEQLSAFPPNQRGDPRGKWLPVGVLATTLGLLLAVVAYVYPPVSWLERLERVTAAWPTSVTPAERLRELAEQGDADAQNRLGLLHFIGGVVRKDLGEAARWFRKAAEQRHAGAQHNLGRAYENGEGVAKNAREAAQWYRKAAKQGDASAQRSLGRLYENGEGVPKNAREAAQWYRKAAEQGDAAAQTWLGALYAVGEGVPRDAGEAVQWYRKAAEQGYAAAQSHLGLAYSEGEGLPKDAGEAVQWHRKAAEQGYAWAQFNLGILYDRGEGVPKDAHEAARWYRKAAEQGHAKAQFSLGVMYERGEGVAKDAGEAAQWYRKAAEQGHAKAQFNLGASYYRGEGVAKDFLLAYGWVTLAAAQGDVRAVMARTILQGNMTPAQIAEVEKRSRELVR